MQLLRGELIDSTVYVEYLLARAIAANVGKVDDDPYRGWVERLRFGAKIDLTQMIIIEHGFDMPDSFPLYDSSENNATSLHTPASVAGSSWEAETGAGGVELESSQAMRREKSKKHHPDMPPGLLLHRRRVVARSMAVWVRGLAEAFYEAVVEAHTGG